MRDSRLDKWAHLLTHYSLQAKKGETALLTADPQAMPLLDAVYEALIKAGVHVDSQITPNSWSEINFQHASDEQLSHTSQFKQFAMEHCDLYVYIDAQVNTKAQSQVNPQKQKLVSQARMPLMSAIMDRAAVGKCRWVYTHFPTPAAAQDAEMSTSDYEQFVFQAAELNHKNPVEVWKKREKQQNLMVQFLEDKSELTFQNEEGTDLTVNIANMKWVNCCGKINFPDGEVYTGPNLKAEDGGVNGVVRYSFPTIYRGVEVHDIELVFEKGAAVQAKASKGQEFLQEMIHQDEGAKYVGEIAIGTNWNIQHCTKNILFDEKFGGTFHLALGKGYPQTGNTNQSALHWDMIFDLRKNGIIKADGEPIFENGRFFHPDWPTSQDFANPI